MLVVWFALVVATAIVLRSALVPTWSGASARLAECILGLSVMVVEAEVLGLLGWFGAPGLLTVAVIGLAAAIAAGRDKTWVSDPEPVPAGGIDGPQIVAAGGLGVLLATAWGMRMGSFFRTGITEYDSLNYHLTQVARFNQTGSFTSLHFTSPESGTQFHPLNSELLHGIGMAFLDSDVLSVGITFGFAALAILAAWCIGRPSGRGPLVVAGVVAVVTAPVMLRTQPGSAANDILVLALFLAIAGLLLQRARGAGFHLGVHGLAALAAGLAAGGKGTALVPMAVTAIVMAFVFRRAGLPRVAATWIGGVMFTGSFWYLRNLLRTGNPVPIVDVGIGPLRLPKANLVYLDEFGYSVAHYWNRPSVWRSMLLPGMKALGDAWPVLVLLAVAGAVLALRRGRPSVERALGVVAIVGTISYLLTPTGAIGEDGGPSLFAANLRYVTPPLALAIALLLIDALLGDRWRQRAVFAVLGALSVWSVITTDPPPGRIRTGLVGGFVLGLVCLAVVVAAPRVKLPDRSTIAAAAVASAALVAVGLAAVEGPYIKGRYSFNGSWAWAQQLPPTRIAIAGFDRQYALYGEDQGHHVQYVGVPGPHGAFALVTDCPDWRSRLNAGRFTYVVTSNELGIRDVDTELREAVWLEGDPAVEELPTTGQARVFRLLAPLDPALCPPPTG